MPSLPSSSLTPPVPKPCYACLYRPPVSGTGIKEPRATLETVAREFSPRYEHHRDDLVVIDVSGLERLLGPPRVIAEELGREAAARGLRVHVAVAATQIAALILAQAQPGITVVAPGGEAAALAPVPVNAIEAITEAVRCVGRLRLLSAIERWGIRTLGALAALPPADLAARLGARAALWQALARGEDIRPLVPDAAEERFTSSIDLEWPIDGLEPLSFVLTRLLEPLSIRLEQRDRGAARLYVELGLVTPASSERDVHRRRLDLPAPIRDVRALRTLALLDLESHPPSGAIERVTITIDPAPGPILQHTLFARALPTPEQLSTLLARLGALMGQDRIGAPATVDSYRPGAFEMRPFATERPASSLALGIPPPRAEDLQPLASALRRCRQPVPAGVAVDADDRPVRMTTDRRGFAGGAVVHCAGPWRTSGHWWEEQAAHASQYWNRDEWDVALGDGTVYRIFRNRDTGGWFIDGIVD